MFLISGMDGGVARSWCGYSRVCGRPRLGDSMIVLNEEREGSRLLTCDCRDWREWRDEREERVCAEERKELRSDAWLVGRELRDMRVASPLVAYMAWYDLGECVLQPTDGEGGSMEHADECGDAGRCRCRCGSCRCSCGLLGLPSVPGTPAEWCIWRPCSGSGMPATGPRVSWRVSASRRLMQGTYSVSTATQRLHTSADAAWPGTGESRRQLCRWRTMAVQSLQQTALDLTPAPALPFAPCVTAGIVHQPASLLACGPSGARLLCHAARRLHGTCLFQLQDLSCWHLHGSTPLLTSIPCPARSLHVASPVPAPVAPPNPYTGVLTCTAPGAFPPPPDRCPHPTPTQAASPVPPLALPPHRVHTLPPRGCPHLYRPWRGGTPVMIGVAPLPCTRSYTCGYTMYRCSRLGCTRPGEDSRMSSSS